MKLRCYWGFFGEHVRNMGTHWELEWEHVGNKEKMKIIPSPLPNLKEKKSRHFECMLSLPIGCTKFLFPKLFLAIFCLC
jgi:hypothetical protein